MNNKWVEFELANVDTFIICIGFELMNVDTIHTLARYEYDPWTRIATPYSFHLFNSILLLTMQGPCHGFLNGPGPILVGKLAQSD